MMNEYRYNDGNGHVIVIEATDTDEAMEMLSQIVAADWPDTDVSDWTDD